MGHQQDQRISCGRQLPDPLPGNPGNTKTCSGQKSVIYEYDDNGQCVRQTAWPCNSCGNS
ncbi:hypothetical protein [Streptomyces sp. NPDC001744]|uniref:hypothetical protein n=1 Tax=Streptomyces sp. NPDC001744 TaxID=3364606 RepID=UPI0036B6BB87